MNQQLSLWDEKKPPNENFIECIYFDGTRKIFSTLSPEWQAELHNGKDDVWGCGWVRREKFEEYLKEKKRKDTNMSLFKRGLTIVLKRCFCCDAGPVPCTQVEIGGKLRWLCTGCRMEREESR